MSKNTKNNFNSKFYSEVSKKLAKIKEVDSGTITFKMYDGSIISVPFSMNLFRDENNRPRNFGQIITILNDLKNDYRSKKWELN